MPTSLKDIFTPILVGIFIARYLARYELRSQANAAVPILRNYYSTQTIRKSRAFRG
jgi:hypothetical protein